ncbi:oligosaccharide flippase family protein [Flavobacterium sp. AG291]|uniref:oligosaccharide flippase family protein n=1 Tax=Flavobacterium sp. AG291 TaxID=2184000 RepID=UPI000E0A7F1A|nr:oligosaccharide flippase family protein [Flavobacterium sp. AG291]RDI11223.1 O-antigen/teichoic acid export membrane protein [Flavobacterium sp. AG291]
MKFFKSYINNGFINNIIWSIVGHGGTIFINFFTNILFARLLTPEDFGMVAVLAMLVSIGSVLCDCGLSGALVRKKNAGEVEYATVLAVNVRVALAIQILLLVFSPFYGSLYGKADMKYLINASGVVILLQSFYLTINVHQIKELQFQKRAYERLIAALLASVIAIVFALAVGGIWSVITYMIANPMFLIINHIIKKENKITIRYSHKAFQELYPFGVNTTFSSLLIALYENIFQFVMARYFSFVQVGYYYQAKKLQDVPCNLINMLTQNVFYARLSRIQDDMNKFITLFTRVLDHTTLLLGFLSTFLFINAEFVIVTLFGEKWEGSVYYIKLLTIGSFFLYIDLIIRLVFKIYDKTRILLNVEIAKKIFQGVMILIAIMQKNIELLIMAIIVNNLLGATVNLILARKILDHNLNHIFFFTGKVILFSSMLIALFTLMGMQNIINNKAYQLACIPALCGFYFIFSKNIKTSSYEFDQ